LQKKKGYKEERNKKIVNEKTIIDFLIFTSLDNHPDFYSNKRDETLYTNHGFFAHYKYKNKGMFPK